MQFSCCSMKTAGFGILPTFMILPNNIKPKADPAPARPSPRLEISFLHIFQYVHYLNFNKNHLLHVRIRQLPGASPLGPHQALQWTH